MNRFVLVLVLFSGCVTVTSFDLPPNTKLRFKDGEKRYSSGEIVKRRPFFWSSLMGVEYELLKDNEVVGEGKIPVRFRIISLFWPPYAEIYWPFGFARKKYNLQDGNYRILEKTSVRH